MEYRAFLQKKGKGGYEVHIFDSKQHFDNWSKIHRGHGGRFVSVSEVQGRRLFDQDHRTLESIF